VENGWLNPLRIGEDASVDRSLPGTRWEPADTALAHAA
jgi:hypothetical protein